jgi:hypothetical protein
MISLSRLEHSGDEFRWNVMMNANHNRRETSLSTRVSPGVSLAMFPTCFNGNLFIQIGLVVTAMIGRI